MYRRLAGKLEDRVLAVGLFTSRSRSPAPGRDPAMRLDADVDVALVVPAALLLGRFAALAALRWFAAGLVPLARHTPQPVDRRDAPRGHRRPGRTDRVEGIHRLAPPCPLSPLGGRPAGLRCARGRDELLLAGLDLDHHHAPPEEHRAGPG